MMNSSRMGRKGEAYTIMLNSEIPISSRVDFGVGYRKRSAQILKQLGCGANVLLLSQSSLPLDYVNEQQQILSQEGFTVTALSLPDGESAKTISQLESCWEAMQKASFTRNDTILAIGGGALTDLAGFCASTYLRGIKLVLLPTTLLAQVDASIGGKTAINLSSGKNLAGSFYFPSSVIVDPEFLQSLPERELKSGMGEIIKYAYIEETVAANAEYKAGPRPLRKTIPENFANGISADNPFLPQAIALCIRMKLAVVLKDPFEARLRRSLNLGHTLGHGVEKVSQYQVSHGEAVAIGTAFAFKLAAARGLIAQPVFLEVEQTLNKLGLPYKVPAELDLNKIAESVAYDKKRAGKNIKYVLPEKEAGQVSIDQEIAVEELAEFIRKNG